MLINDQSFWDDHDHRHRHRIYDGVDHCFGRCNKENQLHSIHNQNNTFPQDNLLHYHIYHHLCVSCKIRYRIFRKLADIRHHTTGFRRYKIPLVNNMSPPDMNQYLHHILDQFVLLPIQVKKSKKLLR